VATAGHTGRQLDDHGCASALGRKRSRRPICACPVDALRLRVTVLMGSWGARPLTRGAHVCLKTAFIVEEGAVIDAKI
jgi:hypothetical protein